ncbi:AraC family transcriptional regulator [Vibrio sp. SM6]|uniref:AraC family transcriptional regulator n=1 Tax=Vibrio agarilyticus TaxID=2726741 RepID=A0A7X8YG41_9VIBR|nr:AraC family transcriptional regulator [Vibrio agarilyticus]NLS12011.1 AraC family transcriptional regulator [Vibrio agarilyticus]
MQNYHIETDAQGRELVQHGDDHYPCAFYDERFSQFMTGEVPWHWHDELELVLVAEGRTQVETLEQTIVLEQGEMILVNSGALHRLTDVGACDCRILNVVFAPKLLTGERFNRLYHDYIVPLISNPAFRAYRFSPQIPWQRTLIDTVALAFGAWQTRAFAYELLMSSALAQCWQQLGQHEPQLWASQPSAASTREKRLSAMVKFIESHFSESLSVAGIARHANISESECFRLFKAALSCTPNRYLLDVRLRHAAHLLQTTRIAVTEIAHQCGFNCPAYFTKQFRQRFAQTPSRYRVQSG